MSETLLTQEVGSLAKPNWRVGLIRGDALTPEYQAEALQWANRLDVPVHEIEDLFCRVRSQQRIGELSAETKSELKLLAARLAVRLQERAGIDIVYDGEQDRAEMYQHAIARTSGFEWAGRVRAFDNKSFKKAVCVADTSIATPWHRDEVTRLASLTQHPIKVPVTGAYTLGAWSHNNHYESRSDLVLALAENVVHPTIQSLLNQGVEWIQIDEPAATTIPGEVPLFVESANRSVAGLVGKFSIHICFSDYSLLFPHTELLENCSQFSLEFANRDGSELGTDAANRPAYEILADFKRHNPDTGIGLGVTSVHDDELESPELVRDRILRAVDIVGDPTNIYPSPDCGLRTRTWGVAYDKLARTAEGRNLAHEQLA